MSIKCFDTVPFEDLKPGDEFIIAPDEALCRKRKPYKKSKAVVWIKLDTKASFIFPQEGLRIHYNSMIRKTCAVSWTKPDALVIHLL